MIRHRHSPVPAYGDRYSIEFEFVNNEVKLKQLQLPTITTATAMPNDKTGCGDKVHNHNDLISIVNPPPIDYALIWSRALASCSIFMLFAGGDSVNFVTGSMIVLISVIGIFGKEIAKKQNPAADTSASDRSGSDCFRALISVTSRMLLIQLILMTIVLLSKSSARMAGMKVNEMTMKLIFTASAETKALAFGDFMNYQMIAQFILKEASRATIYGLSMGLLLLLVASTSSSSNMASRRVYINRFVAVPLKYSLVASLLFALGKMSILYFSSSSAIQQVYTFASPPPVSLERKPSIIIASLDSLRNDHFSADTFPLTVSSLLGAERDSIDQSTACTRWPHHDSGAFQSDQGFASLFYSSSGLQHQHFLQHKSDKSIKSWPLETLRSQGYHMHRIMAYSYKFCWVISSECDLHYRDFDTITEGVGGGDGSSYTHAKEWIRERLASSEMSPFLLSIDLQDSRFPYSAPGELNSTFLPELSEQETYLLKQKLNEMPRQEVDVAREKLLNRVKNSLRRVDVALSTFVQDSIIPLLSSGEDVIFIITGDHGEILMDGTSTDFGHAISSANDAQRLVPMFMCGTHDIIDSLRVRDREGEGITTLTSHAVVLPSILRACGADLGKEWENEVFALATSQKAQSSIVSRHPWEDLAVITSQSSRTVIQGSRIIESVGEWDKNPQLINLRYKHSLSWPGLNDPHRIVAEAIEPERQIRQFETHALPLPSLLADEDGSNSEEKNFALERLKELRPSIDIDRTQNHLHDHGHSHVTIDIVSIGSNTRFEYLEAQASTWTSHPSVRYYWGFTEKHAHNETCDTMTDEEVTLHIDKCVAGFNETAGRVQNFISDGYTLVEDKKRRDAGWICAQRRVGRALGWLKQVAYKDHDQDSLPDLLLFVDDDTYIDLDVFEQKIGGFKAITNGSAEVLGPCLFRELGYIKWPFSYGGFGTFFSKASIQQMIRPIHCKRTDENMGHQDVCKSIRLSRLGESPLFHEGMSIAELFHDYSSLKNFCIHSDWLLGYIAKFYLFTDIQGIEFYPSTCGNLTLKCYFGMEACHRQTPEAMEFFSRQSRARAGEGKDTGKEQKGKGNDNDGDGTNGDERRFGWLRGTAVTVL